MQLFRHFPLRYPKQSDEYIIAPADRGKYPALAGDFEVLDRELLPHFRKFDNEAQHRQYWYRLMYVILVFGGALTTILIVFQIAFLALVGFDIAGTMVASVLGAATAISRAFNHHERYLNARLVAERLRGEYFLFLGSLDEYADDQERVRKLHANVLEICEGEII